MKVSGLVSAMLLIIGVQISRAGLILDQSFDPGPSPSIHSFISRDGPQAQTFTVGIGGTLARVDVDVARIGPGLDPLVFDLRATTSTGAPIESDTTTLAVLTIPGASIPTTRGFLSIDISTFAVTVKPGDVLAIVLQEAGSATAYDWSGGLGNPYSRGALYFRTPVAGFTTWTQATNPGGDVGFRTFVESVPEPGTLFLLASGLATTLAVATRKRTPKQVVAGSD